MKILITAFEPFGESKINSSYEAVKLLPDEIEGAAIVKEQFPVIYDIGEYLEKLIEKHCPSAVICTGQAEGRSAITPEKIAINQKAAKIADNNGVTYSGEYIKTEGDAAYFSTLPVERITKAITEEGIPSKVSYHAGTYVCNCTMYRLLWYLKEKGINIPAGFIHLPLSFEEAVLRPDLASMPVSLIAKGLEVAVMAVIGELRDKR